MGDKETAIQVQRMIDRLTELLNKDATLSAELAMEVRTLVFSAGGESLDESAQELLETIQATHPVEDSQSEKDDDNDNVLFGGLGAPFLAAIAGACAIVAAIVVAVAVVVRKRLKTKANEAAEMNQRREWLDDAAASAIPQKGGKLSTTCTSHEVLSPDGGPPLGSTYPPEYV